MAETLKLKDDGDFARQLSQAVREKFRPALIVMSGERVGVRVSVQGNFLIGRDADCALVLPDPGVSGHHALLEDRGGAWALVDLGSTNGISVNGQKCFEADLRHGDKLTLGTTVLRFEVQDDADKAYSEMIAELVHIDDLTNLYLRRRFDTELTALIGASRTGGRTVSLLVMDLDGIKAINDAHGHLFGAYTISESGKLIGRMIAGRGFAARFGGDEFVAALPDYSLDLAAEFAERIRSELAAFEFVYEGVRLYPAISIGVASFPADADDPKDLFRRADEALYLAKRTGKNRVCRYIDVRP
ncbi:MAG TPA: GGDEF domain-containing protein [Polyangiaceae bacterium]